MIDVVQKQRKRFKASLAQPVKARLEAPGLVIEASADKSSYSKGSTGKIHIVLLTKENHTIGGPGLGKTKVSIKADDSISLPETSKWIDSQLARKSEFSFAMTVKKTTGAHKVTVEVHYQSQSTTKGKLPSQTVKLVVLVTSR